MNLSESNTALTNLLSCDNPFLITRMGIGPESVTAFIATFQDVSRIPEYIIHMLSINAGIYNVKDTVMDFANEFNQALESSDYLATWRDTNCFNINDMQNAYINRYKMGQMHFQVLEPFYSILNKEKPWSHKLLGKKVLIINPFVDSIQEQIKNNFQMFKDDKLFLDGQEFLFYKTHQTQAGNHIHGSWKETYKLMCADIGKLDFDVALLGCGGYGLPLCNFIHTKMNKSAIYIGGGLQLLFGIMGKRWENQPMWIEIISKNDAKFIRPTGDEICKNNEAVEGGCYW